MSERHFFKSKTNEAMVKALRLIGKVHQPDMEEVVWPLAGVEYTDEKDFKRIMYVDKAALRAVEIFEGEDINHLKLRALLEGLKQYNMHYFYLAIMQEDLDEAIKKMG